MKKLIAAILMLFLFIPSVFAGENKTIFVTSGTQMQTHGGISNCVVLDMGELDLSRWEFSFQLLGGGDVAGSGGTVIPVFYCSNTKHSTTSESGWASVGTNYVLSSVSGNAIPYESGLSDVLHEFTSGVTPCKYIMFGYLNGQVGSTPYGIVHMR